MPGVRLAGSIALAVAVTAGLFLFMQYLIGGGIGVNKNDEDFGAIRFGPVEIEDELAVKSRQKPPKPPPPKDPPPPPKLRVQNVQQQQTPMPRLNMPKLDIPVSGSGPFLGNFSGALIAEGDVVPTVRISPQYPPRAARQGLEGQVTVEFTITETGSVIEPVVIETSSPVFNREAIKAISRWKFKPRVIDGTPVARRATQTLEFNLDG